MYILCKYNVYVYIYICAFILTCVFCISVHACNVMCIAMSCHVMPCKYTCTYVYTYVYVHVYT